MQGDDLRLDLEQLVFSSTLPDAQKLEATKLLEQLETPIRVVLAGADACDRLRLLGALLCQSLSELPPASIYVQHGPVFQVSFQSADGSITRPSQGSLAPPSDTPIARTYMRSPHPILEHLRVHLPGRMELNQLRRNDPMAGLAHIADIVIWATDSFTGLEASQWAPLPRSLKDHSLLVHMAGLRPTLPDRLDRLKKLAKRDFYAFCSVDLNTVQTIAEAEANSLRQKLAKLTQLGVASLEDRISLFLDRHEAYLSDPEDEIGVSAQVLSPLEKEDPPATLQELQRLYKDAAKVLRKQATLMCDPPPDDSHEQISQLLQGCAETAEHLTSLFEPVDNPDPTFCALREEVLSSADRLLLMSMETGVAPAIDAVSTLLQMRRDFDLQFEAITPSEFTT